MGRGPSRKNGKIVRLVLTRGQPVVRGRSATTEATGDERLGHVSDSEKGFPDSSVCKLGTVSRRNGAGGADTIVQ